MNSFEKLLTDGWNSKSKLESNAFINTFPKFEFLIDIVALHRILQPLASITEKRQGRAIDFTPANQETRNELKLLNSYVKLLTVRVRVRYTCSEVPGILESNMYRESVLADLPESYYRRTIVLPLVDN